MRRRLSTTAAAFGTMKWLPLLLIALTNVGCDDSDDAYWFLCHSCAWAVGPSVGPDPVPAAQMCDEHGNQVVTICDAGCVYNDGGEPVCAP